MTLINSTLDQMEKHVEALRQEYRKSFDQTKQLEAKYVSARDMLKMAKSGIIHTENGLNPEPVDTPTPVLVEPAHHPIVGKTYPVDPGGVVVSETEPQYSTEKTYIDPSAQPVMPTNGPVGPFGRPLNRI